MVEYKIVRVKRNSEKKTKEVVTKKNKTEIETYIEVESWDDFYERVEKTLNNLAKDNWMATNMSYALPINGKMGAFGLDPYGYSLKQIIMMPNLSY